jgi:hypothetical protein
MPRGPKGEKRPADVIGAAIMVGRIAAKLLQAARKLPPGSERHGILKESGKFRVRINRLRAQPDQLQTSK